jgi:hypothetical protein
LLSDKISTLKISTLFTFESYSKPLYIQQKQFIRLISYKNRFEPSKPLFKIHKILPFKHRYVFKVLKFFYNQRGNIPVVENQYKRMLRNANLFTIPKPAISFFTRTFKFIAPKIFNQLPLGIRNSPNEKQFLFKVKQWLFQQEGIDFLFTIQQ